MADFTGLYNTPLSPADELRFQMWARANGKMKDLGDYDLRGYWKAGGGQDARGHGPDTFKKPNHPTFSNESIYSRPGQEGGNWSNWGYQAGPQMSQDLPRMQGLVPYMQRYEPTSGFIPQTPPMQMPDVQPMGLQDVLMRMFRNGR